MCTPDCVLCCACVMGPFGTPQITPETQGLLQRGKRRRASGISVRVAKMLRAEHIRINYITVDLSDRLVPLVG